MKAIISLQNVLIVVLGFCLTFCNNSRRQTENKAEEKSHSVRNETSSTDKYPSVEIYCWCFSSNRYETVSQCTSPKSVTAAELIKKENLFRLINNKDTIERLRSAIFSEKKSIKENRYHPDSRFAFVFKINDSKADTINVFSDSSLHYNSRYYFNYPFNVMDSIKVILDKTEINCKSNYVR